MSRGRSGSICTQRTRPTTTSRRGCCIPRPGLTLLTQSLNTGGGSASGAALGAINFVFNDGGINTGEWTVVAYTGGFRSWKSNTLYNQLGGGGDPARRRTSSDRLQRPALLRGGRQQCVVVAPNSSLAPSRPSRRRSRGRVRNSVCCIAGRFVVSYPQKVGQFAWSALNAGIMSTWASLDYATAEAIPDSLVGVAECRGELILFGSQSIEH